MSGAFPFHWRQFLSGLVLWSYKGTKRDENMHPTVSTTNIFVSACGELISMNLVRVPPGFCEPFSQFSEPGLDATALGESLTIANYKKVERAELSIAWHPLLCLSHWLSSSICDMLELSGYGHSSSVAHKRDMST